MPKHDNNEYAAENIDKLQAFELAHLIEVRKMDRWEYYQTHEETVNGIKSRVAIFRRSLED